MGAGSMLLFNTVRLNKSAVVDGAYILNALQLDLLLVYLFLIVARTCVCFGCSIYSDDWDKVSMYMQFWFNLDGGIFVLNELTYYYKHEHFAYKSY